MTSAAQMRDATVFDDLEHMLADLSDQKVMEIAGLFDSGGADPQALKGRSMLRDRLRVLRPQRKITPCRLFCVPFELLLSDDQSPDDPLRQVARAAILPTWHQVESRLPASVLKLVRSAGEKANSPLDDALRPAATALWSESSRIIEQSFDEIAHHVGDAEWLQHIGGAMQAHEAIVELRVLLEHGGQARPSALLSQKIGTIVERALDVGEQAAHATALTASLHFESPGNMIGVLLDNTLSTLPGGKGRSIVLRLRDTIVSDIECQTKSIEVHAGAARTVDVIASLDRVVDNMHAMQELLAKQPDPKLKLVVEQARSHARSLFVDQVLSNLQGTFDGNLNRVMTATGGRATVAAARGIEDVLTGVRQAKRSAKTLSAVSELEKTQARILHAIKVKAMVVRDAETAEERRKRVTLLARYVEQLEGSGAAQACMTAWLSGNAA